LSSNQANFDGNAPSPGAQKGPNLERTSKVGSYKPNAFGLYDMHGNVAEWCNDWYDDAYHTNSPRKNPRGPANGFARMVRGGGWDGQARFCRSAFRNRHRPAERYDWLGFRVAVDLRN
jgi:formylglycine-generating enzyme required for sulfatase activity